VKGGDIEENHPKDHNNRDDHHDTVELLLVAFVEHGAMVA
jgi:hypothetical protein